MLNTEENSTISSIGHIRIHLGHDIIERNKIFDQNVCIGIAIPQLLCAGTARCCDNQYICILKSFQGWHNDLFNVSFDGTLCYKYFLLEMFVLIRNLIVVISFLTRRKQWTDEV